ncbi:MAG: hypothetical protein EBZ48_13680 [Proteobacteria bacterium]|nr:hypothetical protein [Pseudomonadota bacterium]
MEQAEFVFGSDFARVRVLPRASMEQSAERADLAVFLYEAGGLGTFLNTKEISRLRVRESEVRRLLDSVMECDALEELLRLRDLQKLAADEKEVVKHAVATQLAAAQSDNLPLYSAFTEGIAKAVLFSHLLRQILPHTA